MCAALVRKDRHSCEEFFELVGLVESAALDGYSRYVVQWEIRAQMLEQPIEIVLERARECFPQASPRIISDNEPQFIAKDFKEYINIRGMAQVRTSPYYPESNDKLERWNQSVKKQCIGPKSPDSAEPTHTRLG